MPFFIASSHAAVDFGDISKAKPAELPAVASELEHFETNENELFERVGDRNKGFGSKKVRAYDPVNKKYYQKALAGTTFKASIFSSYTHWRYVTVYNVKTVEERIAYLPYFQEECHDNSGFMGQWGETRSMKVTLKTEVGGSVSYAGIGLSASVGMSIEQGVSFSSQRRIRAVEGIQARHYPYKLSDTWKGVTYIQTYNSSTKKYGYLGKSLIEDWFGGYPYSFSLDNQNIGMSVKREVLKKCAGYDASKDPVRGNQYNPENLGF